jgi:outer membrane protein assembly factor BamB
MLRRDNFSGRATLLPLLTAVSALVGCYDQAPVPGDAENDRLRITNDELVLERRVDYPDEDVPIDAPAGSPAVVVSPEGASAPASASAPALAPRSLTLKLATAAEPPVVNGTTLQATSVWQESGNRAIVSYAVAGAPALGGLDVFQVVGNGPPRLRSSVSVLDGDVFSVTMDANYLYAGQASLDPSLPSPAVLERLALDGNKVLLLAGARTTLESFAVTSTASNGRVVYATSGDAGGVYALDPSTFELLGSYPLDNARWVTLDPSGARVVVAQGQPGRLSVFREGSFPGGSMELLSTAAFPGANVAESKTTVEVLGGKAFVAAGPEGVQIVCLADGQVIGSVPRPDPASVGLDPSVVVTNAVTVQDDLMFISNGEAGVYAAAGEDSFATDDCTPPSISMLGRLRFADLQSANHVAFLGDELYVAAGLGGIKIVDVTIRR